MKKLFVSLVLVGVVVLPAVSSAAVTHLDAGFRVNDKDVASVRGGSTVKVTSRMNVPLGDEAEYARTYLRDNNGMIVEESCDAITPRWVGVKNNAIFNSSIKVPAYLPDQGLTVGRETFGVPGNTQSDKCDPDNMNGSAEYEGVLFVDRDSALSNVDESVGGTTGTGTVGGSDSDLAAQIKSLLATIADLQKQIADLQKGGSSTKPACPPMGVSTFNLQTWLVANGYMSQSQMDTGPGIYGPRTTAANANALQSCR